MKIIMKIINWLFNKIKCIFCSRQELEKEIINISKSTRDKSKPTKKRNKWLDSFYRHAYKRNIAFKQRLFILRK